MHSKTQLFVSSFLKRLILTCLFLQDFCVVADLASDNSATAADVVFPAGCFSRESIVSSEDDLVRSESSSKCFCFLRTFQCRHSAKEANQSEIWSCEQIEGTG